MAGMLVQVLEKTISQNPDDQKRALEFLQQASSTDITSFVKELAVVLRQQQLQTFVRQAAGLQLKNVLYSKDEATRVEYLNRWLQLPGDVRAHVKEHVTNTLGTETFRPSIAAQCVAAIACAEIPNGLWPDIIAGLMKSVTAPSSTETMKEATLETLGYICQDIDPLVLQPQANEILTAIVHGMRKDEPIHVRGAATNALFNSLEFTRNNFANEPERNIIMQVVCEATQCTDPKVKVAALQCLVRIMSLYYQFMESYMGRGLFAISVDSMRNEQSEVALQGIEFWSNVCEEEIALQVEAEEAQENNRVPEHTSRHYAKGAVAHVAPILLETLAKQEEGDDEDDWTPSKAAGVCIMLMAQCVGNDIVEPVLPFLSHFVSPRWQYREAAIMAFGSILDGPDPAKLAPYVDQALPPLINALSDSYVNVRDTTAWTIGRMCETCPDVVTRPAVLQSLLPAMSAALHQEPRVATNVCWAIVSLAKASYEQALGQGTDAGGQPETFVLSSCFEGMVKELIKTTDRPDGNQANLRLAAFETLMELIKNSPKDCYPVVQSTTLLMLRKLEQLLDMEAHTTSASDKSQLMDLQALLCATLQSVLRKMHPGDAPQVADAMMHGLLQIMDRSAGRAANVIEEALLSVSTLVEVLKEKFVRYMDALRPHLMRGLASAEDTAVCNAAVGVVADMCRSLGTEIAPILDDVMHAFVQTVQNPRVSGDVKVAVLGAFGDIALAIGLGFERYQQAVVNVLYEATVAAVVSDPDNTDQVDYVDHLREQCIMAYTGMVQGVKNDDNAAATKAAVTPFAQQMCALINKCCEVQPVPPSDTLLVACAGLIGDLISVFGADIIPVLDMPKVTALLSRGRRCRSSKIKSLANWATKEIRKVAPAALIASP